MLEYIIFSVFSIYYRENKQYEMCTLIRQWRLFYVAKVMGPLQLRQGRMTT